MMSSTDCGLFRGMVGIFAAGFLGAGFLVMVDASGDTLEVFPQPGKNRKRRQFRKDRPALALTRGASGKVAGQRCGERLGAVKGSADKSRVPRLPASPVPCRA
jgi:hypothetical protein